MYADRLPPHDAQAEESVIGSVLIDGDSLHKISSQIRPTDFYGEKKPMVLRGFSGSIRAWRGHQPGDRCARACDAGAS